MNYKPCTLNPYFRVLNPNPCTLSPVTPSRGHASTAADPVKAKEAKGHEHSGKEIMANS